MGLPRGRPMFVTSSATHTSAQALGEAFQRLAEIIFGQMDMDQAQGRGVRPGRRARRRRNRPPCGPRNRCRRPGRPATGRSSTVECNSYQPQRTLMGSVGRFPMISWNTTDRS